MAHYKVKNSRMNPQGWNVGDTVDIESKKDIEEWGSKGWIEFVSPSKTAEQLEDELLQTLIKKGKIKVTTEGTWLPIQKRKG